jgi:ribosomal protein RSM22 (predicted rRNA methylase)
LSALPASVRQALDALLAGRSRRDLVTRSHDISEHYREKRNSRGAVRDVDDALAYAVARMPATYAAMAHALGELTRAAPELRPTTLLDAGCGPGSAAMAAVEAFPGLRGLDLLDRNLPLLSLAKALLPGVAGERSVAVTTRDATTRDALPPADLVTAGYVLAELREAEARALARALWASARQALVITEPGTPDSFRRLRLIRDDLIAAGAHVAAPCTHHAPCPMAGDAWCRVPVRVQRSRDHRALKGGTLAYEDEPVAYLVLTREPVAWIATHRIVGPAQTSKIGVSLPVCGSNGLTTLHAASRDPEKFKRFRKLDWGDAV